MFSVFDYYNEQNKNNSKWVEEFQSTSDKKSGKIYSYRNTNFRTIYSFYDVFKKFVEYNDLPSEQWDTYQNGQTKAKHWTVRMQQSKFFSKSKNRYTLTAKGKCLNKIVENEKEFNDDEKWLLIYLLTLNSYFNYIPNYIIKKTEEVYKELERSSFSKDDLNKLLLDLLSDNKSVKIDNLFKADAFWILTFYKDKDFISLFKNSELHEKEKLINYVTLERNKIDSLDLIGHKYVNSGQYNSSMFIDEAKTLFVTRVSLDSNAKGAIDLVNIIVEQTKDFLNVDLNKVKSFIDNFIDVFDVIFNESILNQFVDYNLEDIEDAVSLEVLDIEEKKHDETTTKSSKSLRKTSSILKRMAKEHTQYKCELDGLLNCKYFTSKENEKNYLEIHHLIPFQFSNEFEKTLEVLENYVALCPFCHGLVHFGTDRERIMGLTYLFNKRKDKLNSKGLNVDIDKLKAFYAIEE